MSRKQREYVHQLAAVECAIMSWDMLRVQNKSLRTMPDSIEMAKVHDALRLDSFKAEAGWSESGKLATRACFVDVDGAKLTEQGIIQRLEGELELYSKVRLMSALAICRRYNRQLCAVK